MRKYMDTLFLFLERALHYELLRGHGTFAMLYNRLSFGTQIIHFRLQSII